MVDIVHVLLPRLFDAPFTYKVPASISVSIGSVVRVPLGKQMVIGVVWPDDSEITIDDHKIKYIDHCFEDYVFGDRFVNFIDWVADYTMSPKGMVLKMALSVPAAFEPIKPIIGYAKPESNCSSFTVTKARSKVLDLLEDGLTRTSQDIMSMTGVSSSVVKGLVDIGALETRPIHCDDNRWSVDMSSAHVPILSEHQEKAADVLCDALDEDAFNVTLLDGVTGSGKTEVYFTVIEKVLQENEGQVLVMLPEIVLTAQFTRRFKKRFGFEPEIWHSMVSAARRREVWRGIAKGDVRLVIGARSALFLPYKSLKLIIVDEEHEAAFKQEDGVFYHARDMAVMRARMEEFPVVLASATPSVETMVNVRMGRYDYASLPVRHGGAKLPVVHVVDMRQEPRDHKRWLSVALRKSIQQTLDQDKQVLLFLNRRGYAPLTLCGSCGERLSCDQCSSWLVNHRNERGTCLQCHHCGFQCAMPGHCAKCGDENSFVACGPGVERLVEEVKSFLPEARVVQMTSDTVSTTSQATELVQAITDRKWDVIVGTQMIAKGYHFPYLALVGVVDADLGLAGGDMRAAERTYQLLHQVAGRAGREGDQGMVYLQSYMPENAVIQALSSNDREAFYQYEIASRQVCNMPPFCRLVAVIISSTSAIDAKHAADLFVRHALFADNITVLGPAPAPLYKLRNQYRYRLLIKCPKSVHIQSMVSAIMDSIVVAKNVTIRADVDPYSFF